MPGRRELVPVLDDHLSWSLTGIQVNPGALLQLSLKTQALSTWQMGLVKL